MRYFVLVILTVFSINVQADRNAKQEQLEEFVQIMNMDSVVDTMYSQMEVVMQNMSTQMGVQPSEQPIYDEYFSKMTNIMRETMSWEQMKPMVIDIYDRNFTEKEVSDMLKFYRTDTGKAIIKKLPVVTQESMQMSQAMMQQTISEIQVMAKQLAADLKKAREKSE
ncbi:DUF2059 domain-containing protein [Rheinheimera pacifica]|uniref:DUF2059 domain-containing protein n=1 Tax=Rheinheimera pacifica TaxID=173990 RepID=A0A1H6KTY1_9GAMM|nr:DUF2059 domain-containing protein [Rheinheimera pacifica]SEH79328.1 hypothetical protein SAMN05660691_01462 [Rheinheimera pacifica]